MRNRGNKKNGNDGEVEIVGREEEKEERRKKEKKEERYVQKKEKNMTEKLVGKWRCKERERGSEGKRVSGEYKIEGKEGKQGGRKEGRKEIGWKEGRERREGGERCKREREGWKGREKD